MADTSTSVPDSAFQVFVDHVIQVDQQGPDRYVGSRADDALGRVYGGEVGAQSLRAAACTVAHDRHPHSIHISFLRLGDPSVPVTYDVCALRDSALFATRLVTVKQAERVLASVTVSFQVPRDGIEHQSAPDRGSVPAPDTLPTRVDLVRDSLGDRAPAIAVTAWPIDLRYVDHPPWAAATGTDDAANRLWVRAGGLLDDDPVTHACVLTYASDLTMFEPVVFPHNGAHPSLWEQLSTGAVRGATLDHSVWFHRPFRADEWLLHRQVSPVAHGSRGFCTGEFRTADGMLVASVAQEAAILAPNGSDEIRAGG